MSNFDVGVEIRRENARLRAWAAYGLPVEGRWAIAGDLVRAELRCRRCGWALPEPGRFASARAELVAYRGRRLLRRLYGTGAWCDDRRGYLALCAHLAPLAGEDPQEVADLIGLEMLAGD